MANARKLVIHNYHAYAGKDGKGRHHVFVFRQREPSGKLLNMFRGVVGF